MDWTLPATLMAGRLAEVRLARNENYSPLREGSFSRVTC
jgi:hypothetical protein